MLSAAAFSIASALMILGLAASSAAGAAPAQQLPALAEGLSVREVEVVLDPPPLLPGWRDFRLADLKPPDLNQPGQLRTAVPRWKGLADLAPGDVLVLEDGRPRNVVRLEPLAVAAAHPWSLRIHFDLVLARPATVFGAALALARQADELVELGAVEIVVADPEPRAVLASSRDAPAVKEALAALASRSQRDPRSRPFSLLPPPSPAALRRQCDRLVTSLAEAAAAGPHALLLVADPPRLSPAEMQLLARVSTAAAGSAASAAATTAGAAADPSAAAPSAPGDSPARILGETARLLAAYGWVTVALPIRRLPGLREPLPEADAARFRRQAWADPHAPGAIPIVGLIVGLIDLMRGKRPPDRRLIAPQVDIEDAALMSLVRPTAGLVVPHPEAVSPALSALAARWHLWYQADATPAGREREIAVSLLANGLDLRTRRWVRSSTPESLEAARLRRVLDGDSLPGPLRLSATLAAAPPSPPPAARGAALHDGAPDLGPPGPETSLILLAQEAPCAASGGCATGPLRVSSAWTDSGGALSVSHQLLDAAAVAAWNQRHALLVAASRPPGGRRMLAVLVEDLAAERWGWALVAPGAGGSRQPSSL